MYGAMDIVAEVVCKQVEIGIFRLKTLRIAQITKPACAGLDVADLFLEDDFENRKNSGLFPGPDCVEMLLGSDEQTPSGQGW